MTREHYEQMKQIGIGRGKKTEEQVIAETVNDLIQHLYKPCEDHRKEDGIDWVADGDKCKHHGIEDEPINWGDLKVVDVTKYDDTYVVTIDEADPRCPTFADYIVRFMKQWGWNVRVETEW